ncbi:MAG: hypothetical protein EOP55_13695, partial [Sphingobacteriales bacterium]
MSFRYAWCLSPNKLLFLIFTVLSFFYAQAGAQIPVKIDDSTPHQLFSFNEIDMLEDVSGKLTFGEILTSQVQGKF